MEQARPYEVEVNVGGATTVKTVWAYSAEDAVYQAVLQAKRENGVFQIAAVRPPKDRQDDRGKVWTIKRKLFGK